MEGISIKSGELASIDKNLQSQRDEWSTMLEKGKIQYVFTKGIGYGVFTGILWGIVFSFFVNKAALKINLLIGSVCFGLLGLGQTLFKWKRYKKKFGSLDDT